MSDYYSHHGAARMLTPGEVADMLSVAPETVARWARAGKITSVRTLGGHRRYPAGKIRELRAERELDAARTTGRATRANGAPDTQVT